MNRAFMLLAVVILAGLLEVFGSACGQSHRDMYLGTDAGAGFEAPVREEGVDVAADAAGAGDQGDAGAGAH